MSGAIPPLSNMPPWLGAQLKKSTGQLYMILMNSISDYHVTELHNALCSK